MSLTVVLEELEGVIEALLAHVWEDLWVRREQSSGHAVHVVHRHLQAGVGQVDVVGVGRAVARADVTLARKRWDAHGGLVQLRNVVTETSINIPLKQVTISMKQNC